jgi:hypothetical protein
VNLEYYDEWKNDPLFLADIAEMLDNVLQYFIDNAPAAIGRAKYSAERERSIGIGALGFHAYLQGRNIAWESALATSANVKIFKHIREKLNEANTKLGTERGEAPDAVGTGNRFSHLMAIAPNASSSIIMGNTSPSVEPYRANAYRQDTLSGAHLNKNKFLNKVIEDYLANPVSSLVTVKCAPWSNKKDFFLIGDAAHAIVPFFGQGMNCGFEDCSVLDSLIEKHDHNWSEILPEYETLRKPDGDAIADLAVNNFYEMSDRVNDPSFLLQKKIEANFSSKYPEKWVPAYSLVTFSPHLRYSYALSQGKKQDELMREILQSPDIEHLWNTEMVEQKMAQFETNQIIYS